MQSKNRHGYVGIMICEKNGFPPFPESRYFKRLCLVGQTKGLTVFVFSPSWIDWTAGSTKGFVYLHEEKRWEQQTFPVPQIIYDRCFYRSRRQYETIRALIGKLGMCKSITFLGFGLRGKWDVLKALNSHPETAGYIPLTAVFKGSGTLREWLPRLPEILLKPHSGSQGRGIVVIKIQDDGTFALTGRDRKNKPFQAKKEDFRALSQWITSFIGESKYLIQPFLPLSASSGEAYDIRVLMQKDHSGLWQQTGMAARVGKPGSVTSNLHGGGHARDVDVFLQEQFGEPEAKRIMAEIKSLSEAIPGILEQRFGRLAELGLDLGIDRNANIWILEANSKPGRQVFSQIHNRHAHRASILNPIYYARFLLDRHLGG